MAIDLPLLLAIEAATVFVPRAAEAGCAAASGDEIVVCRRSIDPDRYRLPPLPPRDEPSGPPRAEWELGHGVRAGLATSAVPLPAGRISNRVMATIKIPF